jgi:hypothetical protein
MSRSFYYASLGPVRVSRGFDVPNVGGDRFLIRYSWTQGIGGRDLDTFTGIEPGTGTTSDGVKNASGSPTNYVGFNGSPSPAVPSGGNIGSTSQLFWGGDNQETGGTEAVLINPNKLNADFPSINVFNIGLYGNWWGRLGNGCVTVSLLVYSGGTYSVSTNNIINTGGTLLLTRTFDININNNPRGGAIGYPSNGINGYQRVGVFKFARDTSGAFYVDLQSAGNC